MTVPAGSETLGRGELGLCNSWSSGVEWVPRLYKGHSHLQIKLSCNQGTDHTGGDWSPPPVPGPGADPLPVVPWESLSFQRHTYSWALKTWKAGPKCSPTGNKIDSWGSTKKPWVGPEQKPEASSRCSPHTTPLLASLMTCPSGMMEAPCQNF